MCYNITFWLADSRGNLPDFRKSLKGLWEVLGGKLMRLWYTITSECGLPQGRLTSKGIISFHAFEIFLRMLEFRKRVRVFFWCSEFWKSMRTMLSMGRVLENSAKYVPSIPSMGRVFQILRGDCRVRGSYASV